MNNYNEFLKLFPNLKGLHERLEPNATENSEERRKEDNSITNFGFNCQDELKELNIPPPKFLKGMEEIHLKRPKNNKDFDSVETKKYLDHLEYIKTDEEIKLEEDKNNISDQSDIILSEESDQEANMAENIVDYPKIIKFDNFVDQEENVQPTAEENLENVKSGVDSSPRVNWQLELIEKHPFGLIEEHQISSVDNLFMERESNYGEPESQSNPDSS